MTTEQNAMDFYDDKGRLVASLPATASEGLQIVGQQVEPSITFHPGDPMKEVMRIDRHGVRVNPEYSVDEATQHVLNALTAHIQHTVNHAVATKLDAVAAKVKTDFSAAFGADTCESWAVWIRSQK